MREDIVNQILVENGLNPIVETEKKDKPEVSLVLEPEEGHLILTVLIRLLAGKSVDGDDLTENGLDVAATIVDALAGVEWSEEVNLTSIWKKNN